MVDCPFVTVVVPTHNRRESLRECLDSVFQQIYPADMFEVLVVDDGSSDKTKEFLEDYVRTNPHLRFFSQINKGPSSSRNLGIENSLGEIVCFTDDDCLVDKDWLSNLVRGFDNETVGGVQKYVEDSRLLNQEKFKSTNLLITGNVAYRKKVLMEAGGFDIYLNACEDLDLSIKVQMLGYGLKYVGDAIVYHRYKPSLYVLFRQQYRNALGFARLHKKYARDFYPGYNLLIYSYRISVKLVTYPLVLASALFGMRGKRGYALMKPLLDLLILFAFVLGMIVEPLFGGEYRGVKIKEKVSFLEDQSIKALFRKVFTKIF
jgi:cellulose synthase/poly-beta-1,6-N-acetylglucosamine synthase-like glycosyltransferase